jgi:hypothetical protein
MDNIIQLPLPEHRRAWVKGTFIRTEPALPEGGAPVPLHRTKEFRAEKRNKIERELERLTKERRALLAEQMLAAKKGRAK